MIGKTPELRHAHVSLAELRERQIAARRVSEQARRETLHWTLQMAYEQLRNLFPHATTITVDTTDGIVITGIQAEQQQVWPPSDSTSQTEHRAHDAILAAQSTLADELGSPLPDLPGWSVAEYPARYRADLTVLPPALALSGRRGGLPASVPDGVLVVLQESIQRWRPRYRDITMAYCRGLVDGHFPPLTSIKEWKTVPERLGLQTTAEQRKWVMSVHWRPSIRAVHGLAAGVVGTSEPGNQVGEEDGLRARFKVSESATLRRARMTLDDLAVAFQDDVRIAAIALLLADTGLTVD